MGISGSKYRGLQETESLKPKSPLEEILSVVDDQEKKYILKEFAAMFPENQKTFEVIKEIRHYTLRELVNYLCRRMRQAADIEGLPENRMHSYWSLILEVKMILRSRKEW